MKFEVGIGLAATLARGAVAFSDISAAEWVRNAQPGWNLGNTLDAYPDEGSWNNPPVQPSTFDYLKTAGFKGVRIPVTYTYHFTSGSPDWTINATWLQRVSDVVDMATARGLYVITNMHHDTTWADVTQPNANLTMIQEKFHAAWVQIGTALANKSEVVALEPLNEPPGNNAADGANLDKLNALFLQAMQESGGYNARRVVTLSGPGMSAETVQWFTPPANVTNPWAYQFHYYSPYDFDFGAWGKTIWGSDADKAAILQDFQWVRNNLTANGAPADLPVLMGEFDASQINCEAAARWKWFDYVVHLARSFGYGPFIWDNGADNLDRQTGIWRDPIEINITMSALAGVNNSLADSTTDPNALSQSSSAFVFLKVGDNLTDQTLPFILNGHQIVKISDNSGGDLQRGSDYTVAGNNLTLHTSFLSKYLSPTGTPGSKTNLTVTFSCGAPSDIEIVQWDVPTLTSYAGTTQYVPEGDDLWLPVVWKGLHKVAACKIINADGTLFVDTWTIYLPPLQQGRATYGNQFNWDEDILIIPNAAWTQVVANNQSASFTFEFYPRAEGNGNNLTYVLSPA